MLARQDKCVGKPSLWSNEGITEYQQQAIIIRSDENKTGPSTEPHSVTTKFVPTDLNHPGETKHMVIYNVSSPLRSIQIEVKDSHYKNELIQINVCVGWE